MSLVPGLLPISSSGSKARAPAVSYSESSENHKHYFCWMEKLRSIDFIFIDFTSGFYLEPNL